MAGEDIFAGYRVLEVATWVFGPATGTVLADFGASVIKIEHPVTGDPQRGLVTGGVSPTPGGVSLAMEQTNRGKRSVGLDIATPAGRDVLMELVAGTDVFLTNLLPRARAKLGIEPADIRAANPDAIYARADAVGQRGPEAGKPGYDFSVFWARAGFLDAVTPNGADQLVQPRPGFGDKTAAMSLAFGIAAALLKRERTGEPSVVDVSLLGAAMWSNSSDIIYSGGLGADFTKREIPRTNPISAYYRTADGRWIGLSMLESDRWWPDFCTHLGRPDLISDPRFADAAGRRQNNEACAAEIAGAFASADLDEWRRRFASLRGPWEVVQEQLEVLGDPQARQNGYLVDVEHPSGQTLTLVRAPVQFDDQPPEVGPAPEMAAHTEEVLLELGHSWEDIIALKDAGVIA
jgi:crotonobetainyl-CoA:carnitine CoA-transferase CaiB-like acyl-CoA transferase